MITESERTGDKLVLKVQGRVDAVTAPELKQEVDKEITELKTLVFDLKGLEYISSAGLRVLLHAQKVMDAQGEMRIKNVSEPIMEILELTGFTNILNIED